MKKKILISTGGSGGHVVPGTIFYEHLKNEFDLFMTSDSRGISFLLYPTNYLIFPKYQKIFFYYHLKMF